MKLIAFEHLPLIYPVVHKSAAFAAVSVALHAMERILVGVLGGRSVLDSMPLYGGGTWSGVLTVWAIMTISLVPFFALREMDQSSVKAGSGISLFDGPRNEERVRRPLRSGNPRAETPRPGRRGRAVSVDLCSAGGRATAVRPVDAIAELGA